MAKRNFDAFYYGVGMKLDQASVDKAGEQLEGRLNTIIDNVSKEVKKMVLAVNAGMKEIDPTGLNKAIEAVGGNLDELVDFDPKKLKAQIGDLQRDFKGLEGRIDGMSDKFESSFNKVNDLITSMSNRLSSIEIITPKLGKDALKKDIAEMTKVARGFSTLFASGQKDIPTDALDTYVKKVKDGIASMKASGNDMELFVDGDLAKDLVKVLGVLREMGAPVSSLHTELFEVVHSMRSAFKDAGVTDAFRDIGYQIDEVNHSLGILTSRMKPYEDEIKRLKGLTNDWQKDLVKSDEALLSSFQTQTTTENFDAIIKKIKEYENVQKEIEDPSDVRYQSAMANMLALAQATEKQMEKMGKKKVAPFLTQWSNAFDGSNLESGNKFSTSYLEIYRQDIQYVIDGIKNDDKYKELEGLIIQRQERLARLMSQVESTNKTGRPQGTKNTPKKTTQLSGEKVVVSPTLKIDQKKWTADINAALQNISESGKLKPVDLRINTQSTKITQDLNKIREAIESTLAGTRGSKKDEQGNPISQYESIFDKSLNSFYTKLQNAKQPIFETVKQFQGELKEAFKFNMTVDGLGAKKKIGAEIGSVAQTYIDSMNAALEDKPIQLRSNIDKLIEEIKEKVQNIKIEGEVGLKAGNTNLSGLVNAESTGLAKDSTVQSIYDLLRSRGGAYAGVPIYIGGTIPKGIATNPSEVASLQVVEAKAKAEEKGAKAVERKVAAEEKSTKVSKSAKTTTAKTDEGFDKQQIYNALHYSIKDKLDTFTDVDDALKWIKAEAKQYTDALKNAKEGSEEYFKAQAGLTTLLHQWRSKIAWGQGDSKQKRYNPFHQDGVGWRGQGNLGWSKYLTDNGLKGLLPNGFELSKETAFRTKYGLEEPKKPKKQSSSAKSKKIEESAEEMIARDFEHTKKIAEHVLKLAKWAKALGVIANGLDYTITEADFKDRDTVSRNGVTYTKQDLEKSGGKIFSQGSRLTADVLDEFVAEYENSEDEEFKGLFGFVKKLIDVQRESQGKLDAVLKDLDGTDIATKYGVADDKSEYLAKNIKSTFGRLMGKSANKTAQTAATEILSKYGVLDSFQKLATEQNPEAIFKTLQDNVLNDANIDKMIGELSALDGNVGKTYQNFINLLKIAKEFMLTSNSISAIGQEARNWIGGTKERRDKYKKVVDKRTGRTITTDEVIGVENKVIENGLRQMIQEFKAIFINEAGERILGFNDGKGIVDNFVGGNASFTKIINALVDALAEAVYIQISGRGVAKDYVGVRKHERVSNIVDAEATPTYQTGVKKTTESETITQQISELQKKKQKAEEDLNRLRTELNETVSDAEVVTKLLDISEQKGTKGQSLVAQKNKIYGIKNNIQALEKQLTTPAESFESIQTQLLQTQEVLLDMQKKFNAMPNATENDREAKAKFKEQIDKEKSTIARLQEKTRDAQRTYEEGVADRLIEEQSANIKSLEDTIANKQSTSAIDAKRERASSLKTQREGLVDKLNQLRAERDSIKPRLSASQELDIKNNENLIQQYRNEYQDILNKIKELEKSDKKDPVQIASLKKQRDELARNISEVKAKNDAIINNPSGGYSDSQNAEIQKKTAEIDNLTQQINAIVAEEQPLKAEISAYDVEIKFLQDTIKLKKKYIESLRDGLKSKKVMLTSNEIQAQLDAKTQELAQAQAEQERLQAEYAAMQSSEDEIINRELEALRSRKTQKEARIKEIDSTNDSANNVDLQNERNNLEAEIAQIDKHINDGLVQTIIRIKAKLAATQASLDSANKTLLGLGAKLKDADSSNSTYTKGGKILSQADAKELLPQAETRLEYEIEQIDTILNAYLLQKTEALTELTAKAVGGEIKPGDAKAIKSEMASIQSLSDNLSFGKIKEEEYVNKVTAAYVAMQKVMGEVNESAARATAQQLKGSIINKQRLEQEIALLKERAAIVDPVTVTKATTSETSSTTNSATRPKVAIEPEIQPGEVAEEVRENVAETPATAPIQTTVATSDTYTSSGQIVQAVLGGKGLATEGNQQTIIDLLKSGIKVNGKTSSPSDKKDGGSGDKEEKEVKKKVPKIPSTGGVDAQADEIKKLTNINKESNVYKRYESMMTQLNDALKQAEEKGDAFTTKDADRIRGLMTNISGLGRKIIEASGAFEQLKERGVSTTEYIEDGVKSLEAEMLNMAQSDALSKNALLTDVSYDDVKQRMTYVLTDLEGSTTRVTMAYNEMFGSIVTTADKTTDSVRKVYRAVEGEMTKMVQSGNLIDDLTGGNSVLKNSDEYKAYTTVYGDMMKSANDVRAKGTLATQQEKNELIALVKQVETARISFEKLAKASSDFDNKIEGKAVGMTEGQSLETQMKNYVLASQPWTAAQRKMIEETWKFNNAQNSAAYSVEKNKGQLSSMSVIADKGTKRIGQYTQETKKYQSGMEKFMDSLKNKWKEVARYLMTFGSMYRVFAMLKQGIQYVREIDSALTELKKVTDETEESYERFLKTAAKTADKIGSTIKEIVSSTADWARIGYSLQDAATLAESTAILLNVSEFQSIDEATSALTSTLQAFSYTAEQSMDVIDVLNEIGNNFSISSDGIATALKDSASSLVAANNSYEEAVALIASANRVVQDPNSVGAALRTISLRLRSTSTEQLEEAGEDTVGAITSKSKLQSKVKGLTGVDILTDTGSYRSTYDILLDISKVWKDISDIDQAECCLYVQKCA